MRVGDADVSVHCPMTSQVCVMRPCHETSGGGDHKPRSVGRRQEGRRQGAGVMRGIFVVSWRDVQVMSIRDAGAGYLVTTCDHNTVTRLESEAEV